MVMKMIMKLFTIPLILFLVNGSLNGDPRVARDRQGNLDPSTLATVEALRNNPPVFAYVALRSSNPPKISLARTGEVPRGKVLWPQFFDSTFLGYSQPNTLIIVEYMGKVLETWRLSELLEDGDKTFSSESGSGRINVRENKTSFEDDALNYSYIHIDLDFRGGMSAVRAEL